MKKLLALILSLIVSCTTFVGAGCVGNKGSDAPDVLEIYCFIAGYSDDWLTATIDLFEEEQWVKDKYPNLQVKYEFNGDQATAINRINNQSGNTTDLFFSVNLADYPPSLLVNLTDAVYLTEVPGEDGLIIDKLTQDVKDSLYNLDAPTRSDGYDNYYAVRYVDSFYSFYYNADKLDAMDLEVPVTTRELEQACLKVETEGYTYSFEGQNLECKTGLMISAKNSYIQHMFPAFWMQYEGVDGYSNFYKGEVNGILSRDVTQQKGRLRALETMDQLVNNHAYKYAGTSDYKDAQTNFLAGEGLFHWNGDYFTSEMRSTRKTLRDGGNNDNFQMMAIPVMSCLVEKLSFYNEPIDTDPEYSYATFQGQKVPYKDLSVNKQAAYDAVLAAVIKEIDAGVSYEDSTAKNTNGMVVSQSDWQIISDARSVAGYWTIPGQSAVIPSRTPAKELAADFLRFMYTDKAMENFAKASQGLHFPAKFYEELDGEDYNQATQGFETEAKAKFDLMFKKGVKLIPASTNFPLGKAGLDKLTSYSGNLGIDFTSKEANRNTAKTMFEREIAYWSEVNWEAICKVVGYM